MPVLNQADNWREGGLRAILGAAEKIVSIEPQRLSQIHFWDYGLPEAITG